MNERDIVGVREIARRLRRETRAAKISTPTEKRERYLHSAKNPSEKEVLKNEASLAGYLLALGHSRSERAIREISASLFMTKYCGNLERYGDDLPDKTMCMETVNQVKRYITSCCPRFGDRKRRIINETLQAIETFQNGEIRDNFFDDFSNGLRDRLSRNQAERIVFIPLSNQTHHCSLRVHFVADRQEDRVEISQQPRKDGPEFWGIDAPRMLLTKRSHELLITESCGGFTNLTRAIRDSGPVSDIDAEQLESLHCLLTLAGNLD